jgi:CHASE3 domain sensor protein
MERDLVDHTQEVMRISDDVLINVINLETGVRGYIITNNKEFLDPYLEALPQINKSLTFLKLLSKNNLVQQLQIDSMIVTSKKRTEMIAQVINTLNKNELTQKKKIDFITEGKQLSDYLRMQVKNINNSEYKFLKEHKSATKKRLLITDILFFSLVTLLLVVVIFVYYMFHRNNKNNLALQAHGYSLQLA